MKYVKFTGDYAKLKSMGYQFGKYYGHNYMAWSNDRLIIWKRGSEIESCGHHFNLYNLIEFIRRNPHFPVVRTGEGTNTKYYQVICTRDVESGERTYLPLNGETMQKLCENSDQWRDSSTDDTPNERLSMESIPEQLICDLQALSALGWYELVDTD